MAASFTNKISCKKRSSIGEVIDEGYLLSRIADIVSEATRQVKKNILSEFSECIGCCKVQILAWPRRALAVWGLTADDSWSSYGQIVKPLNIGGKRNSYLE